MQVIALEYQTFQDYIPLKDEIFVKVSHFARFYFSRICYTSFHECGRCKYERVKSDPSLTPWLKS